MRKGWRYAGHDEETWTHNGLTFRVVAGEGDDYHIMQAFSDGSERKIATIRNDMSYEEIQRLIAENEIRESARKMKKFFEFNDSRIEAFRYAIDSEWRMLCLRNDGITHEETQLDDKNFVALITCPQGPMSDWIIEAFKDSMERMGFKLDYYTDDRDYAKGIVYQFNAIDNQTQGYDSLMDEPVEIVGGGYTQREFTLRQAIEEFGISREPENPNDARVFARCPSLHGFIGPMAPNGGYVARYETQEAYDMLSTSVHKSFDDMVKEQRNKHGKVIG